MRRSAVRYRTGGRSSESLPRVFVAPVASETRPFAVGDRQELRIRRASARREHDLAMVRDQSLEDSAVAYLAVEGADIREEMQAGVDLVAGLYARARGVSRAARRAGGWSSGATAHRRLLPSLRRLASARSPCSGRDGSKVLRGNFGNFGEALSAHTSFYGPPVPGYNMPRVRKMLRGMEKVIDAPPRRKRRAVRT